MKTLKILLVNLLFLVNWDTLHSQTLINSGAKIVQVANGNLVIKGNFLNQLNGNIINSGIISITGNWINNAGSGNLMMESTGYVQFLGQSDQIIGGTSPTWFPGLNIYQSPGKVSLETETYATGIIEIAGREFWLHGHTLHAGSHVLVSNAGIITVDSGAVVEMANDKVFTVFSGGFAQFLGIETNPPMVKCPAGYYQFEVFSGGNIIGNNTIFQNMNINGLQISGNINLPLSLHNCTFREGEPDGTLITFNNPFPVTINNAHFPANTWGGNFNVTKLNDEGKVTFDCTYGDFAGETHEDDPMNAVDWINTVTVHHLSLEQGWSGLSSWLVPLEPELEMVFEPILPDVVIVINLEGMYYPSQNINTLGNWESHDAFMIKMQEAAELTITGFSETNYTLQLNQGWTLMPVVSPCPVSCDELFSAAGDTIQIVKEVAGTRVYWPSMGIYSLDKLYPAKSYMVRSADPILTIFPSPNCNGYNGFDLSDQTQISHQWNKAKRSNLTHTIGFDKELTDKFHEGDVIGVFTVETICAGVAKVLTGLPFSITAFGDDHSTPEKDGFATGEVLKFIKYNQGSNIETELNLLFKQDYPNYDGHFVPNGISVVKEVLLEQASIGEKCDEYHLSILPNPTNGNLTISGLFEATQLRLTDIMGINLIRLTLEGEKKIELDLTGKPKGIYFIITHFPGKVEINKVVIN